jgi:hypothetical protein
VQQHVLDDRARELGKYAEQHPVERIECRAFITALGTADAVILVDLDDLGRPRSIALPGKSHSSRSHLIQKKRKRTSIARFQLHASSKQNPWSCAAIYSPTRVPRPSDRMPPGASPTANPRNAPTRV